MKKLKKQFKALFLFAGLSVLLLFSLNTQVDAQDISSHTFSYSYMAEIESEGGCYWIATSCTPNPGTTCTHPGTKSRGWKYCGLNRF